MTLSLLPARSSLALLCWLAGASAAALGGALIAQYGFGMRPCHLCIWQRWPYGILIALGVFALVLRKQANLLKRLLCMALLLLIAETGIAAYHSAVERHWVEGPNECAGGMDSKASIDELRAQILGATVTRCDEAAWLVPGISMANANAALALGLLIVAYVRRPRKEA